MNQTSAKLNEIKKERSSIEDKLISATKDYTTAVNGNSNKFFSGSHHGSIKKQHKIDEKKALMELWKEKLASAVSLFRIFISHSFLFFRIKHSIQKWRCNALK